jgi:hypothetical protein
LATAALSGVEVNPMLRTPRAANSPPRKHPSPPAAAHVADVMPLQALVELTRNEALSPATGTMAPVS